MCLYSCLPNIQYAPESKDYVSYCSIFFSTTHPALLTTSVGIPHSAFSLTLCQEREASKTILPIFKNYNSHCFFFLTTCKMSRWKAAGEKTGLPATKGEKESTCKFHLRRQLDVHLSHHPAPCCMLPSTRRLDHVSFPLKSSRNLPFPWLSLAKDSRPCQIR